MHLEDDALALAEGTKDRPLERPRAKQHLGAVVVAYHYPEAGGRIVDLDDSLESHGQAFWTLPARMQAAQTRARRVLEPWTTRTRWILGSQRRWLRLWEKLTVRP